MAHVADGSIGYLRRFLKQHGVKDIDKFIEVNKEMNPSDLIATVQQQIPSQFQHQQYGLGVGLGAGMSDLAERQFQQQIARESGMSQHTDMASAFNNPFSKARNRIIKFFRINEEIEVDEGSEPSDPVDQLRMQVAQWLT
jgi:hypothetical protein